MDGKKNKVVSVHENLCLELQSLVQYWGCYRITGLGGQIRA